MSRPAFAAKLRRYLPSTVPFASSGKTEPRRATRKTFCSQLRRWSLIKEVLVAASLCIACDKTPTVDPLPVAEIQVGGTIGQVDVFNPVPGVTCFVLAERASMPMSCVRDSR